MTVMSHFAALDAALVEAGWPATSPWWRAQLERFYASGRRQLVLRVGRRGGKSSTLCRIAVLEAVFGEHVIPPGDVGIVGVVSVDRREASARLRTIAAILNVLRVPYRERDGEIALTRRPVVFRVHTGSVAGVVGGTWICAVCDEVARWRDADTGANPATEVLASLRPTMATQPHARIFLSSSPLGSLDAHAVAFDAGETDYQCTAYAPTWLANPSVTEAQTRADEPIDRVWRREYLAEPQGAMASVFGLDTIDAAMARRPPGVCEALHGRRLVIDASRGVDAWTYLVARWVYPASTLAEGVTVVSDPTPLWNGEPAGSYQRPTRIARSWDATARRMVERRQVQIDSVWQDLPASAMPKPKLMVETIGEVPDAADTEGSVAYLTEQCRRWADDYGRPDPSRGG